MLAHLLQPRVMEGAFGRDLVGPTTPSLSVEVGGPYTEGDTIVVTVHRAGPLVGACAVDVQLTGLPEGWLVGPALQGVTVPAGSRVATASFPTQIVIGDQGDSSVTAQLLNPVGCEIAAGSGSGIFSIADSSDPPDPPTLAIARHADTPATIDEGSTARFVVTSSYSGLATPATFDYAVTTGTPDDLVAPVAGNDVPIAGDAATVEIAAATAPRSGAQGNRTLTAAISGAVGATIVTAAASVTVRDVLPSPELRTPLATVNATRANYRDILLGQNGFSPLDAGTHVILADDTSPYDAANIVFTRSGTASNPIVIRATTRLGVKFRSTMAIKGSHVWLWGLDFTNGKNILHQTASSIDDITSSDWPFQIAVSAANVRVMRCKIDWTRMYDSNRGSGPRWCQCIGVGWRSSGFRLWRNIITFSGVPVLGDINGDTSSGARLKASLNQGGGSPIRPVVLFIRENKRDSDAWANNRDAIVSWNVCKDLPGDDFFDDIAPTYNGQKLSAYAPYDSIVRGQAFSIGGEQNYSVNGKTSGMKIHHNYIAGNGADFDFGAIKCDGQDSCYLDFNTVASGDGMRLRVAKNWKVRGNWLGGGRGLYGNYGEGHVYIGNYCAVPLGIRSGNCTNDSINPYPQNTDAAWAATGYPAARGTPQPAAKNNKLYGNRGTVYVGWKQFSNNGTVTTDGTEIYGHMSLDGTETRSDFNSTDLVDKGNKGSGTIIRAAIPRGIVVPDFVQLTESMCGPNSGLTADPDA